jgi:pSer/pThr/pTyr-binding forkhead associated (FHA) protein
MVIEDLSSANGTYVNRSRVPPGERRALKEGDVIQVGAVQLKVLN